MVLAGLMQGNMTPLQFGISIFGHLVDSMLYKATVGDQKSEDRGSDRCEVRKSTDTHSKLAILHRTG